MTKDYLGSRLSSHFVAYTVPTHSSYSMAEYEAQLYQTVKCMSASQNLDLNMPSGVEHSDWLVPTT
jgi:hypothetical protein